MRLARQPRHRKGSTMAMGRLRDLVADIDWPEQGRRLAGWLNPVVASPAAPLETFAAMDAVGPSLMPRTSRT